MSVLDEAGLASDDKFGSVHKGIDPTAQLVHGEKIGLGERAYELISLDKEEPRTGIKNSSLVLFFCREVNRWHI